MSPGIKTSGERTKLQQREKRGLFGPPASEKTKGHSYGWGEGALTLGRCHRAESFPLESQLIYQNISSMLLLESSNETGLYKKD